MYRTGAADQPLHSADGVRWRPSQALSEAWEIFAAHWVTILGAMVLSSVLAAGPGYLVDFVTLVLELAGDDGIEASPRVASIQLAMQAYSIVASAYLRGGLTLIVLKAIRRQDPRLGELFSGFRFGWRMLVQEILGGLLVCVGLVLFLVPGVILGLGLSLSSYFVVDRDAGAIESLQRSWDATKGHKSQLFLLGMLFLGLTLASLLLCGLPLLVLTPLALVAHSLVYVWITAAPAPHLGVAHHGGGMPQELRLHAG